MSQALFDRITAQIVEQMEAGATAFSLPWHKSGGELSAPRNAVSEQSYRGGNVISLWASAFAADYEVGIWATYRQWTALGAQVRKGERGTPVIFWQQSANAPTEAGGDEPGPPRLVARCYTVFNAAQVDGYEPPVIPILPPSARVQKADEIFSAKGAEILHGGDRAYYSPGQDKIQLPAFEQFKSAESYYAVLAHELVHWTGAKHRLDRDMSTRFGTDAYATEELVAELGAAFICAQLGLSLEPRPDHAAYLSSWIGVLRANPRALFSIAAKAQAAADYLLQSHS